MKIRLLVLLSFFCVLPLQAIKIKVKAKKKQYQVVKNKNKRLPTYKKTIVHKEYLFNKLQSQRKKVAFVDSIDNELPFVIVICAYNNAKWVIQCLDSVCKQKYTNFRIIYVDDNSKDNAVELIKQYREKYQLHEKITLITNKVRSYKLANIYKALHSCQDHEIIVQLDGDDWLAHKHVLSKLNMIFHNPEVWFSYGQYTCFPVKYQGVCREIPCHIKAQAGFRKRPWVTSHVKAFYAWLFKAVKLQDLIAETVNGWEGKFYPYANDFATVFPMLDMARTKIHFEPEIMYVYNYKNPLNGGLIHGKVQNACSKEVRALPVYDGLTKPLINRLLEFEKVKADIILLAGTNNPMQVAKVVARISQEVDGKGKIVIFYNSQDEDIIQAFNDIEHVTSDVVSVNMNKNDWKEILGYLPSNYIVFTHDTLNIIHSINLTNCILDLERTFAHGVYFALSPQKMEANKIPYQHVLDDLYAWKFKTDKKQFYNTKNADFVLYRKKDIIQRLKLDERTSLKLNTFKSIMRADPRQVGLFYQQPKALSVSA